MVDVAEGVSLHSLKTDKVYGKMDIKTAWEFTRSLDYQLWFDFTPTKDFLDIQYDCMFGLLFQINPSDPYMETYTFKRFEKNDETYH